MLNKVTYAQDTLNQAALTTDFGKKYAQRLFGEDVINSLPLYTRGAKKGQPKGKIVWRKITQAGWARPIKSVVKTVGRTFAHGIFDGKKLLLGADTFDNMDAYSTLATEDWKKAREARDTKEAIEKAKKAIEEQKQQEAYELLWLPYYTKLGNLLGVSIVAYHKAQDVAEDWLHLRLKDIHKLPRSVSDDDVLDMVVITKEQYYSKLANMLKVKVERLKKAQESLKPLQEQINREIYKY